MVGFHGFGGRERKRKCLTYVPNAHASDLRISHVHARIHTFIHTQYALYVCSPTLIRLYAYHPLLFLLCLMTSYTPMSAKIPLYSFPFIVCLLRLFVSPCAMCCALCVVYEFISLLSSLLGTELFVFGCTYVRV